MDLGGVGQDICSVEVLKEELNSHEFLGALVRGVDFGFTAAACCDGLVARVTVEEAVGKGEDVA